MPISRSGKKTIVLTGGDPSGIGPEIILKTLDSLLPARKFKAVVIGDYRVFERHAKSASLSFPRGADFIDLKNVPVARFVFGKEDRLFGAASLDYLRYGITLAQKTRNCALVTAPISKVAISKAGGFRGGHTEFLSAATGSPGVTMMLVGGGLRVSLVTRHIALSRVAKSLTKRKITVTIKNTHAALKKFFRVPSPRIGVAALNPHAGENGLLGKEEASLISPVVRSMRKTIKKLSGPLPADTLFYRALKGEFDAVVAMYHDQGLAPLKMLAFDKGVNITLGLPFVRTSPDHGTGFDIAGKGKADPASMIEAVRLAVSLC